MISKPYYAMLHDNGRVTPLAYTRERALQLVDNWRETRATWTGTVIGPPPRCVAMLRIIPHMGARNG
jgi:hypothetical protein